MTRKHFIALAEGLRYSHPSYTGTGCVEQWRKCVSAVADMCAAQNGRFDRGRFELACEPR